jgi:hypothetical protein
MGFTWSISRGISVRRVRRQERSFDVVDGVWRFDGFDGFDVQSDRLSDVVDVFWRQEWFFDVVDGVDSVWKFFFDISKKAKYRHRRMIFFETRKDAIYLQRRINIPQEGHYVVFTGNVDWDADW